MQEALHLRAHNPQPLHLSVSIRGLSKAYFDKKPRTVPTGQIVLQYVRPFLQAKIANMTKLRIAIPIVARLRTHTSTE